MFATYTSFYLALAALPLAETVTLFFASPLFITILSALVLKESVDAAAKVAAVAGFIGVAVMFDPGTELFDPAALLAVFSALSYAAMAIATRRLGRSEKGPSLAFYPTLVYIALTLFIGGIFGDGSRAVGHHPSLRFLTDGWRMPGGGDLGLMLLLGLMSAAGFYCLSQAYRLAPPARIAPLEYIAVPLGVLWGFLFWQEVPGIRSFLAMALVVGSGLFILGRGRLPH
jgi:drug/metabolite transporter (DMT)-like permease